MHGHINLTEIRQALMCCQAPGSSPKHKNTITVLFTYTKKLLAETLQCLGMVKFSTCQEI